MAPPRRRTGRPGRPTRLDEIIDHDPAGRPIRVADRIVDLLRAGNYFEHAAAASGVTREPANAWLKRGVEIRAKLHAGNTTRADLTRNDRLCLRFADRVDAARAEATAADVTTAARLAAGGIPVTTVIEKRDGAGNIIERTTRTETTLPDGAMLRWRLERRTPKQWGRQVIELAGPDGGPIELSVEAKRQALSQQLDVLAGRLAEETDWDQLVAETLPELEAGP